MKRSLALVALVCAVACYSVSAQNNTNTLESKIWAPTFGSQHTALDPGMYYDHLLNTTGQIITVLGASVYEDSGASTLMNLYTSDDVVCLSAPVTGTSNYRVAPLNPCTVQPGQALFMRANLDGTTTQFKVNVTMTHPITNGTQTAASNILPGSPVRAVDGCQGPGNGVSSVHCSIPDVAAGGLSLVWVESYTHATPTLYDNGTMFPLYSAPGFVNPAVTPGGVQSYLFVIPNEVAGAHTFTANYPSNASYPNVIVATFSSTAANLQLDTAQSVTGTANSDQLPCGAVTPSTPNEFAVSLLAYEKGDNGQPTGGNLKLLSQASTQNIVVGYAAASGFNAFQPVWTNVENLGYVCNTVTLR